MLNSRAKSQEGGPLRSGLFPLVQLAISVGMVASARFGWLYSHAETDTPPPALTLFLCELPFVFCLLPSFTREGSKRNVSSAGMVFGTALSFCPFLILEELGAIFGLRDNVYLTRLASFLPVCFIAALCMLGVSWLCGKGDRIEFIAGVKRGILGFLIVSLLVVLASLL